MDNEEELGNIFQKNEIIKVSNEKESRNIFQEDELINMVFNKYRRERMIELCGEDWVKEHECSLHLDTDMGGN